MGKRRSDTEIMTSNGFFDTSQLPSWFSSLFPSFQKSHSGNSSANPRTGSTLSGSQQEQAALEILNSREQRDWEENMYKTYQSYSGQVSDMQKAGLNPAMMYDGVNLGSYGSGSAAGSPSGMATTENPALNDSLSVLQTLIGSAGGAADIIQSMGKLGVDTKNAESNATNAKSQAASSVADVNLKKEQEKTEQAKQRFYDAQSTGLENENSVFQEKFNWARTNQILNVMKTEAGTRLTYAQIKEADAQIKHLETSDRIAELRYEADYAKIRAEINKIYSDIEVNKQDIEESKSRVEENHANVDLLHQKFSEACEDLTAKKFDNELTAMKHAYGVDDEGLALAIDVIASGIDDEQKKASFIGYVRAQAMAGKLAGANPFKIIDKICVSLDISAKS